MIPLLLLGIPALISAPLMLRALHALAARIAKENPSEEAAQLAVERAKAGLAAAEK